MEMQEVISRAERNIRQALRDYGAHTSQTDVLDDVTDEFIYRLAADSSYAKQGLRELFSKSPVWNEELDALVINGTRTHDPDYDRIHRLAMQILEKPFKSLDYDYNDILKAICFFSNPDASERDRESYIEAIRKLAPKAYTPTKKPSRVFKSLCVALGVADETAGSEFQRLYAQFADELSAKQIGFKLFVSVNPAHFITMSNPKRDSRGATLTSCHSFNSTEYDYNNGCTGYARDETSFIVFTVADPTDPETLNNRKTTRQVFAYRPGSGLLLQSRMYNTAGGVYGAAEDSKLYRDLVQREISMLEDVPNLWKTYSSIGDKADLVVAGDGFGGYQDWTYENFDGHISIRADCDEETVDPMSAPMACASSVVRKPAPASTARTAARATSVTSVAVITGSCTTSEIRAGNGFRSASVAVMSITPTVMSVRSIGRTTARPKWMVGTIAMTAWTSVASGVMSVMNGTAATVCTMPTVKAERFASALTAGMSITTAVTAVATCITMTICTGSIGRTAMRTSYVMTARTTTTAVRTVMS